MRSSARSGRTGSAPRRRTRTCTTARRCSTCKRVSAHLEQLVARYQPEGGYDPIATTPSYEEYFAYLTIVRFAVTRARSKFKLGQGSSAEARAAIHERLLERGTEKDLRAVQASRNEGG